MTYNKIHAECLKIGTVAKAESIKRFFKTKKGEYGGHDHFLGIDTPASRKISKPYLNLEMLEIKKLFKSKFHEERSIGIQILVAQYQAAIKAKDLSAQKKIYKKYFSWRHQVNNWDLVDSSAPSISGHYYFHHEDVDLEVLRKSKSLWDRRIAVISMFYFIRQNSFAKPLKIIEGLLYEPEDLMHKACGWMLREIGKRKKSVLVSFLDHHSKHMPRTALRYAIEKMDDKERRHFLNKVKL
jgi:3-methyladenine DNA glycosylase AlkD